jgi:hypothetical protein
MEHSPLLCNISGLTQSMTKGPMDIQKAWRVGGNSDFLHQRQANGSYASGFNFSCQQSHGPRADGSCRHEKNQINS